MFDGTVRVLAAQTDGKGSRWRHVYNRRWNYSKRGGAFDTDGTLDAAFNPLFLTVTIYGIAIQDDGKILIGGQFSGVSGAARSNMARLNSDGTVDTSFNAGSIGIVKAIAIQPDGKYLAVVQNGMKRSKR